LFTAHNIAPSRIVFLPPCTSPIEHLRCYAEIDIALDTIPYNGTTTTMESLWMGVPVLSIWGQSHRSRVSAAILQRLGLKSFAAQSEQAYIQTAKMICSHPEKIAALRLNLRNAVAHSCLCDVSRFVAGFEAVLLEKLR